MNRSENFFCKSFLTSGLPVRILFNFSFVGLIKPMQGAKEFSLNQVAKANSG
jgi:hypothetical protein